MWLDFENAISDLVEKDIIKNLKEYKDVLIFGAGESGSWVQKLLEKYNVKVCCFCDNYSGKWGTVKNGLPVESFQNAIKKYPDCAICIASMWADEIIAQIQRLDEALLERSWNLLTTMNWETEEKVLESKDVSYIKRYKTDFEEMSNNLADELSRKTLEGILNYRLTRKMQYIYDIKSSEDIYLDTSVLTNDCLKKIEDSIIIDGGTFDGDSVKFFIDKLGENKVLTIHAYEIDEQNCRKIAEQINQFVPHKIIVHHNALWNRHQEMFICGNGLSGKVDMTEKESKNCVTGVMIDELNNKNVGFIKLDIEGAERQAIEGAKNTIKKCHPILAVCAYHRQDDLLRLFHDIKSIDCGYSIYLRHYMNSAGDTVMYGIPKECT